MPSDSPRDPLRFLQMHASTEVLLDRHFEVGLYFPVEAASAGSNEVSLSYFPISLKRQVDFNSMVSALLAPLRQ